MFPARAGMSPLNVPHSPTKTRVPRASGDEPRRLLLSHDTVKCSPRERG